MLASACQVIRTPEKSDPGAADLVSLRRASEALQERIRQERGHVDAYTLQLRELGRQEQQVYADLSSREATLRQLQGDLDYAAEDLEVATADQERIAELTIRAHEQLDRTQQELTLAEQELATVRAAADSAQLALQAERERLKDAQVAMDGLMRLMGPRPDVLLASATSLELRLGRAPGGWSPGTLAWGRALGAEVRGRLLAQALLNGVNAPAR